MLKDYLNEVKGTEMEFIAEDMVNDFDEFGKDYITTDEWLSDSEIEAIIEYDNTHEAADSFIEKLRRLAKLIEEEEY